MLKSLTRHWWLLALRGVFAILFGILAFLWPDLTIGALVLLFGAYVLIDGVASLVTGVRDRETNDRWWVQLLEGVAGIIVGILTFVWPAVTGIVLLFLIAAWAIVTGIFEIIAAVRLRKEMEGEWALGLSGLLSIIFGVILFINPAAGALALVWVIAAYAIIFGILMIYLAFRVRGSGEEQLTQQRA